MVVIEEDDDFLQSIKEKRITLNLNFVDDDIIIYGTINSSGDIHIFTTSRCFEPDRGCEHNNCLSCPYTNEEKESEIYNKYKNIVSELMRDSYKKLRG